MNDYKIIDNFLPKNDFKMIQEYVTHQLPYYYCKGTSNKDKNDLYYFCHIFFGNNQIQSDAFDKIINPILKKITYYSLIRAKANCYPSTNKLYIHEKHTDFPFPHKGLIFYINNNDGYTILNNNKKIESVENRALFFEADKPHQSTTCTNQDVRLNINLNYV